VALTANAMTGNDALFERHGFDGFIPKPIDVQHLNTVLNKFIRDKYPQEAEKYKMSAATPQAKATPDETKAKLLHIFRRDAEKAVLTLRETASHRSDIKLLTTTAHAMKSALANIGEPEKSKEAAALEQAGLNGDRNFIAENVYNFIKTLESLIKEIGSAEAAAADAAANAGGANAAATEDTAYLKEQLNALKTACMEYDDTAAYAALDRLKEKPWKPETAAALENIRSALFLHSDFEAAAELATPFLV